MRADEARLCHDRRVIPARPVKPRTRPARSAAGRARAGRDAQPGPGARAGRQGQGGGGRCRPSRPQARRPDRGGHTARGRQRRSRTSAAAATSWRPRSTPSRSTRPALSRSTSARRPAASPTSCCSAARAASTPSTWAADNSPSRLRRDRRVVSMERTNARRLTAASLPSRSIWPRSTSRSSRSTRSSARSFRPCGRARGRTSSRWSSRSSKPARGRTDHGVVRDPAIHREVLERTVAAARVHGLGTRARHRLADHRARRAIASSWSTSRPDRAAPRSTSGSTRRRPRDRRAHRLRLQPDDRGRRRAERPRRGLVPGARDRRVAAPVGRSSTASSDELPTTDALVVLGGDGTFLRAARAVAEVDVPLLGINLGKVGFLSKAEAGELDDVLGQIVAGDYAIEERMALEARILRGGRPDRHERPPSSRSTTSSSRAGRWPGSAGSTSRSTTPTSPRSSRTGSSSPARPVRPATRSRPAGRSSTRSPEPDRHPDRRLSVGHPLGRRRAAARSSAARSSTPSRRSSPSTGARTSRLESATSWRSAPSSARSAYRAAGAQPFWDLLRHKVALLPS